MLSREIVEIAGFPLVKLGSLKVRERNWFNQDRVDNAKYSLKLAEIANAIAVEFEVSPERALEIVSNPRSGDPMLVQYADELAGLPDRLYLDMTLTSRSVTMFLSSRLEEGFLSKNSQAIGQRYGIEIDSEGEWEQAYTDELPESVIDAIVEFMNGETTRWKEPEPKPEDETLGEESASGEKQPKAKRKGIGSLATGASS
jgi:hypothetical protein